MKSIGKVEEGSQQSQLHGPSADCGKPGGEKTTTNNGEKLGVFHFKYKENIRRISKVPCPCI